MKTGMRILVCGGRDFTDSRALYRALDRVNAKHGITHIISGGAGGADKLAENYADSINAWKCIYPADWETHGKAAGPMRNQLMVDEGKPDACVAFPGGRGTADMIARCKKAGIPVWEPMK